VINDLLQSTPDPNPWRSFSAIFGNVSNQYNGSAYFGISDSGIPIFKRISDCYYGIDLSLISLATRMAEAIIGIPVAWNENGNNTLLSSIL